MKAQRIAIAITVVNLGLLFVLLTRMNTATAQPEQKSLPVLRGSGLEIMDSMGKVRASISLHAPVVKDGVTYPAGILLRLIDSKGQPSVKLGAAEDGGGLTFSNESQGYIQILAKESGGFIKIRNANGSEQTIKP